MSNKSDKFGRSYEFAWAMALEKYLPNAKIIQNSSYKANKQAWQSINEPQKDIYEISVNSAIDTLLELEPLLLEGEELQLELQKDTFGIEGDVRDLLIKDITSKWEIGLSIKHNHEAVKHSRLSHKLDFAAEWFGIPCSIHYWNDVKPIFEILHIYKDQKLRWSKIPHKNTEIYIPLLQAFMNEIRRINEQSHSYIHKMITYLIGIKDYYKIVSKDKNRLTLISTFNMHGSLNLPGKNKISIISIPKLELPTRLVALEFKPKSQNTIEMYFDKGWQLSFRIHSASKFVEPSLKFDIQFIGMPTTILNFECKWHVKEKYV